MKIKIYETIETIWELPDNYFDDKDYEQRDCSDDELASHFKSGKLLYEDRQYNSDNGNSEIISWDTNVRVWNVETKEFEHVEIKESESSKPKIKIRHDWFIPWIHDDYDQGDMLEAWSGEESVEDHALGIAGLIPVNHIQNWEEIKHYYDKEPFEVEDTEFNTLSEYYEDDGYVEYIPDELEVEWVYEESDNE
tara:strand:- start:116 stop:694 length:579 start_codon:yes stop_codon:yes gene_type:complete